MEKMNCNFRSELVAGGHHCDLADTSCPSQDACILYQTYKLTKKVEERLI